MKKNNNNDNNDNNDNNNKKLVFPESKTRRTWRKVDPFHSRKH